MTHSISEEEFANLNIYDSLIKDVKKDPYRDSLFYPLKVLSSKTKGTRMEQILEEIMLNNDYDVQPPKSKEWDRLINSHKVEIKGSFLWGVSDEFRWQQIRVNQDYDYMAFMAFYPDRLEIYAADKETVRQAVEVRDENGYWIWNQHGGKKVLHADTFFLDGLPEDFPWMKPIFEVIPLS